MSKNQTARYRLRNWSQYNQALVERGGLTVWSNEAVIAQWYSEVETGKRDRPQTYSDMAIVCALTLRSVFRLPLRATQGFLPSLVGLLGVDVEVPDYSTLCRRQKTLEVDLGNSTGEGKHLVINSTGLKVSGEGEWKVRQYGYSKRRTWRKLHLAVDVDRQSLVAAAVTSNDYHDSELMEDLLEQIPEEVEGVSADGGYWPETNICVG